ncbi:hypothetical protein [Lysinibacter cavernae]|uniref:hypothetical protein n=1 Tax=Lysinibacter cavernae TaxID=1640652 RepID=UPI003615ADAF
MANIKKFSIIRSPSDNLRWLIGLRSFKAAASVLVIGMCAGAVWSNYAALERGFYDVTGFPTAEERAESEAASESKADLSLAVGKHETFIGSVKNKSAYAAEYETASESLSSAKALIEDKKNHKHSTYDAVREELTVSMQLLKDAVAVEAETAAAAAETAAAAEAERIARETEAARVAAEQTTQQPQDGAGTQQNPAPSVPGPAPAPVAPAPVPQSATATQSISLTCTQAESVTFTANGGGTVTISAGGGTASGAGGASITVTGPGSFTAIATASGTVSVFASSTASCR